MPESNKEKEGVKLLLLKIHDNEDDKSTYHFDDSFYSKNPVTYKEENVRFFCEMLVNSGMEIFHTTKNQIMTDSGLFVIVTEDENNLDFLQPDLNPFGSGDI